MKLINSKKTLLALASTVAAEVFFQDNLDSMDNWVESKHKSDYGKFTHDAGAIYADESDKGLKTSQDAKFYAMSAKFPKAFTNREKTLVVQYSVKHAQKIDCGGGYVKVFPDGFEPEKLHGESDYNIMFGPDICGYSTKKVHVIFNYNGKNHLIKKEIKCKDDELTHVYTLVVNPDNTYEVFIDGESAQKGNLVDDWDMLEPKEIKDPEASKPEDWVDNAKMDDPEDVKPEEWDDIPEYIADPEAEVPEDWDEDMDGEWEAPMINNPDFKGEWKAATIDNPDYKGPWVHPLIANPDYVADDNLYSYESFGAIGLDLWQVKSGSVFDNFLISDDVEGAIESAKAIVESVHEGEKAMKKEIDDAAAAAAAEAGEDEEGDEFDDEEEMDLDDDFEDDLDDDEFDGHDEL